VITAADLERRNGAYLAARQLRQRLIGKLTADTDAIVHDWLHEQDLALNIEEGEWRE